MKKWDAVGPFLEAQRNVRKRGGVHHAPPQNELLLMAYFSLQTRYLSEK
jgi:hypothetical protein